MPTHPRGMGASSLPKEEEEEGKGLLQKPGTDVSTLHACRRCTQTIQTNTIYPNPARKIKNKPVIEAIWRRFNWGQTTGAGCCCHLQRFLQAVTAAPGGPGPRSLLSEGRCCWGRTRDASWVPCLPVGTLHTRCCPGTIHCSTSDRTEQLAKITANNKKRNEKASISSPRPYQPAPPLAEIKTSRAI